MFVHKDLKRAHTWEQMRRPGHAPWVLDQKWKDPEDSKVKDDMNHNFPHAPLGPAIGQQTETDGAAPLTSMIHGISQPWLTQETSNGNL